VGRRDGGELFTLPGHTGVVNQAVWNGDESRILTASEDGTVRQWYTRMEDLLEAACWCAPRNMSAGEWQRYMIGQPHLETCPGKPVLGQED
jgi:WD40 repeat protein